jgi:hypothetical protein
LTSPWPASRNRESCRRRPATRRPGARRVGAAEQRPRRWQTGRATAVANQVCERWWTEGRQRPQIVRSDPYGQTCRRGPSLPKDSFAAYWLSAFEQLSGSRHRPEHRLFAWQRVNCRPSSYFHSRRRLPVSCARAGTSRAFTGRRDPPECRDTDWPARNRPGFPSPIRR